MKRAAGSTEKEERRRSILDRAEVLFRDRDFEEIRMNDLAASLGLAKGTLYLYFPSKESLFLALLADLLDQSFDYLAKMRSGSEPQGRGKNEDAVDAVAKTIALGLAADPILPRLLSMLHIVLERGAPYEDALAFKKRLAPMIAAAGAGIAAALPPLSREEGARLILYVYAQVVGLVGQSDLSPFMRKVCAEPGLDLFKLDFEKALFESTRAMLAGMLMAARMRERGEKS